MQNAGTVCTLLSHFKVVNMINLKARFLDSNVLRGISGMLF